MPAGVDLGGASCAGCFVFSSISRIHSATNAPTAQSKKWPSEGVRCGTIFCAPRSSIAWPEDWRVECEVEDGGIEVTIFSGPNAHERAVRYASCQYGDFEEVALTPTRNRCDPDLPALSK